MVNTATVVTAANAMVAQYHMALDEKTYSLTVAGVDGSFLVKWILFSFSSSTRSSVISFSGRRWVCWIRLISCFAVSGFCFFHGFNYEVFDLVFCGGLSFLYFDLPSVFYVLGAGDYVDYSDGEGYHE
jgi:hypothetical protein